MSQSSQPVPPFTVGNLSLHDCQVHYTLSCQVVADLLRHDPRLPGVIITDSARMVGMISRQKFFDRFKGSHAETYLTRPIIQALFHWVKTRPLEVSATCQLQFTLEQALSRPAGFTYEPIVVTFEQGNRRLLDMRTLLSAHAQLFTFLNRVAQQQKQQLQAYQQQTEQAQRTAEVHQRLIQRQTLNQQQQEQRTEQELASLRRQIESLTHRHQQFRQLGQRLSIAVSQVFQETQEAVNAVHPQTERLLTVSKLMAKELEILYRATDLVRQVGKQSQFLGLHTAILVNRSRNVEIEGFSRVATEVAQLHHRAMEAGQRMDETASNLRACIDNLLNVTQSEMTRVEDLTQQIVQIDDLLEELRRWISQAESLIPDSLLEWTDETFVQSSTGKLDKPNVSDRDTHYRELLLRIRNTEQKVLQSKRITLKDALKDD